uniref:IQ domain-containing protein E-like n=1 Tax=Styela clava TaxID=7725 RepID=UPI001939AC46|nr:IQ domain-containing protein E-like [Styela clava]
MPSKYSPRTKRPPSPYSVSQSPRTQQRVWRPLSGTGQASARNEIAEGSREKWLRSLRQGTDGKRTPIKGDHNVRGNLNTSLSSTSDYLRDQLGLPDTARKHRRSSSVDLSHNGSPRPMYKSPEDMYDEIISLKKTMVVMKNEYDVLKAKTRRLEEDNTRKDKYIEKLLDPKNNDESIRMLAEGNSKSGGSVVTGLKQRNLKLEKQLRDKENELSVIKNDIKTTDIREMKTAMEIYYQEVLRLRDVISSQEMRSESLEKTLFQLTAENHQLVEDNNRLRRDLDKAIGGFDASSEDDDDAPIKYSALSKVELVNLVKKSKQQQLDKEKAEHARNQDQIEKLKNIISTLKEEKYEFREENKTLKEQNRSFENELDKQTQKVTELRREIEALKDRIENPRERRRSSESRDGHRQSMDNRTKYATEKPRRMSRVADKNKAASSIQRQWREHRDRKRLKDTDDEIVVLQSALRGHLSRQDQLKSGRSRKISEDNISTSSYASDTTDKDVVYLQSALRGHLERSSNL